MSSAQTPEKTGFFSRLKKAVASTKAQLVERIEAITQDRTELDAGVFDDLEATMIAGDLGVKTVHEIMERLRERSSRRLLTSPAQLRASIEEEILAILERPAKAEKPLRQPPEGLPEVIFVVGVNGAGKTTTIAKLARLYLEQNRKPLLGAADTFRAAANEQLEIWARRLGIEIIQQKPGADPSAVVFDALARGKAQHLSPVIVDTAGRLHTKQNLMAELAKMCRIAGREVPDAPHQVLLVIDATTGQNGLAQARQFAERTGVNGIVLTKLDGTAKGGVVVAIAAELGVPIRYVGIGEHADDLIPFNAREFVTSLFEA